MNHYFKLSIFVIYSLVVTYASADSSSQDHLKNIKIDSKYIVDVDSGHLDEAAKLLESNIFVEIPVDKARYLAGNTKLQIERDSKLFLIKILKHHDTDKADVRVDGDTLMLSLIRTKAGGGLKFAPILVSLKKYPNKVYYSHSGLK